jgi:pimeloyl-ACP methyl ester carboxylesterase
MGSELFNDPGLSSQIWLPGSLFINNAAMNISKTLYVDPPADQCYASPKTYGTEFYGIYVPARKIMDELREAFPNRELYFFSYDWRKSCNDNANSLKAFIDGKSFGKVDIVAHSMGGLVASRYYKDNPTKVNKIITLATPYEGSQESILRSLSDFAMMKIDGADQLFSILGHITPEIKRGYPAMAELAPTANYFSALPMLKLDSSNSAKPISYGDYAAILKGIFADNADAASTFHNGLHNGEGFNALSNYPYAYFAIGTGQHTVMTLILNQSGSAITNKAVYNNNGDGTVLVQSASIMGNAPSGRRILFTADHTGIIGHAQALEWVIDILRDGYSDVTSAVSDPKAYTVIRVACPVDATITKGAESLTSEASEFSDMASFGRMDIMGENGEIKMFCIDEGSCPVKMEGTAGGNMDYSIAFYDANNNLIEERARRTCRSRTKPSLRPTRIEPTPPSFTSTRTETGLWIGS